MYYISLLCNISEKSYLYHEEIRQLTQNNLFYYRSFFFLICIDCCYHLPSIFKIGCQCNCGSDLLHIDRHTDAAPSRETNVGKFQVHSSTLFLNFSIIFSIFSIIPSLLILFKNCSISQ